MKLLNFIIFISVVLLVYGLVNYYIFIRGWQVIPKESSLRLYYVILFLFLSLSFWVGRILENFMLNYFTDTLVWIGSFWLAFMLYFFLFIVFFDLIRLVNYFFNIYPTFIKQNYETVKFIVGISVILISSIIIIWGHINFLNPRVHEIEIDVPRRNSKLEKLNIAVASDIHLGTLVRNSRVDELINIIGELQPDIILFPGDIIDEDLQPVIRLNLGEKLKMLKAKYGVYGISGNHEYIGGIEEAIKYLTAHNIQMLQDSVILIDESFYLIGRKDRAISDFTSNKRKELTEVVANISNDYPKILMDHQPFNLHLAQENNIDLQLSGHTHHGQLWPLNFITKMVYELSWGYKQKGNTHYYVSSGFAGWGPPVRTGSRTEVVNIKLNFI